MNWEPPTFPGEPTGPLINPGNLGAPDPGPAINTGNLDTPDLPDEGYTPGDPGPETLIDPILCPDGNTRDAKKPDLQQVDGIASKYGLSTEERRLLGAMIHEEKEATGQQNLSREQLEMLAQEIVDGRLQA